jgi:CheY-like chemotaxis protein
MNESTARTAPAFSASSGNGFAALAVSASTGVLSLDKASLRSCGIRTVHTFSSGVQAAQWLDTESTRHSQTHWAGVDVILCDDTLQDMSGLEFNAILSRHPLLQRIPVILLSASATRASVARALQSGCCGMLLRPYTMERFAAQMQRARTIMRRNTAAALLMHTGEQTLDKKQFDEALAAFTSVLTARGEPDDEYFARGMEYLSEQRYDAALKAFGHAARINMLHAEALNGMARCWKAKGNTDNYLRCLKLAGEAHLRCERFREARAVFAELMQVSGTEANPMLQSAAALVREGRLSVAAGAFLHGSLLSPEIPLHESVARACQFTSCPQSAMEQICCAIETIAGPSRAEPLRKRLLAPAPQGHDSAPRSESHFPRLEEIVAVARHTIRLYRQSAA